MINPEERRKPRVLSGTGAAAAVLQLVPEVLEDELAAASADGEHGLSDEEEKVQVPGPFHPGGADGGSVR